MCDEYWERELAKRWKIVASEDDVKWLPVLEPDENVEDVLEPVVLPPAPIVEDKRRGLRVLTH